jgi:hypothetical protein
MSSILDRFGLWREFTGRKANIGLIDSAYCGMPAGLEAFRVADRVLNEMQEKGEMVRE